MKKSLIVLVAVMLLSVVLGGCARSVDEIETTTEGDPMATYEYTDYFTVYVSTSEKVVASQYRWSNETLDKLLETYVVYADGKLVVDGKEADETKGESWELTVNGKQVDSDLSNVTIQGGDIVQFKLQGEETSTTTQVVTTVQAEPVS